MDAGGADAGIADAGGVDAGGADAGDVDAGEQDAGLEADGGAGVPDGGSEPDGGPGAPDAGALDAGVEPDAGTGPTCLLSTCVGQLYECGNCFDDDGDGLSDAEDPDCTGSCDNSERLLATNIPGANNAPCRVDCYFDRDTGSGDDTCFWDHRCDPLEVAPSYTPAGPACAYNPNQSITGFGGNCAMAATAQSPQCASVCGTRVPNGCDCFGCCVLPGVPTPVYLGTMVDDEPTCSLDAGADPASCAPCTQVPSCLNTCETCELCLGKTELPPECLDGGAAPQSCPADAGVCGLPGQATCPSGEYCVTGCCRPSLQ